MPAPENLTILASSGPMEYSYAGTSGGATQSFTGHLVEGIRTGRADLDADGMVTFDELSAYARARLDTGDARQRPRLLNLADQPISAAKTPGHVFISYSREDREFVRWLSQELADGGQPTWVDDRGITGGDDWRDNIVSAIDAARALLCVLTPDAMSSPWVRRELGYAQEAKKPVIPVIARPTELPAWFKLEFGGLHRVDFRDEDGRPAAVEALVRAIQRQVAAARAASGDAGFP